MRTAAIANLGCTVNSSEMAAVARHLRAAGIVTDDALARVTIEGIDPAVPDGAVGRVVAIDPARRRPLAVAS